MNAPLELYGLRDQARDILPPSVIHWLDRPLPCSKGHFTLLNPKTSFFSYCFNAVIEGSISLLFFLPIVFTAVSLSANTRGNFTLRGHISYLLALVAVILRLTNFYLDHTAPSPVEWFTLVTSALAALLHYIQDGRVLVCGSELLLYWALMAFTTFNQALDDYLRERTAAYSSIPNFLVSIVILYVELSRPNSKKLGFDSVNIFDKISLNFLTPLLKKAQGNQLTREDFPAAPQGMNAVTSYDTLSHSIEKVPADGRLRVLRTLAKILKWEILSLTFLDFISEFVSYSRPLALSFFLKSLQAYIDGEAPIFHAVYFALLVGILPITVNAFMNVYILYDTVVYIISRASLTGMIYRKALSIHPKAREDYDSAKIMNLINVDTDQIDGLAGQLPTLISAPTALVLACWQLYVFIGPTMFVSVPLYIIFTLYSSWASKQLYSLMPVIMEIRDRRTKATTDSIRNIKSLKLYAWERPFFDKIIGIRNNEELALQRKTQTIFSLLSSLWSCTGDVVAAAIFVAFLFFQRGALSPDVVFPCLSLLSYITVPFMQIPNLVTFLGRAVASQNRINDFLITPDFDYKNYFKLPAVEGYHKTTVDVENATISWNGDTDENLIPLKKISFQAGNGDLVCITGKVGTGKTALLKSICAETVVLDGEISVKGSISYCPQDPWLQNKTIKDNILFGKKWDPEFYRITLEACALDADIKQLPEKDDTEVGERGVSLSGGQKARVALARAVYARSDVFVLDDVLSAVDEHVSSHLIEKLFGKNGLIASKTIILATNNIKVLSHASRVIALQDKQVAEQLTIKEVVQKKESSLIYKLMKEFHVGGDIDKIELFDRKSHIIQGEQSGTSTPLRRSSVSEGPAEAAISGASDEDKDTGTVSLTIFTRYFEAAGPYVVVAGSFVLLSSVLIMNCLSVWLGIISNHSFTNLGDARFYIIVYVIIAFVAGASIFLSQFWFLCNVAISVSKRLHFEMLHTVLRSPMRFFDVTPLGKVLNRFTGDIAKLDNQLPPMIYYFVRSALNLVVQVGIVLVGAPLVIFIVIPLGFLGNSYRKVYIPATRQIQRMSSAANSPILSHIEESVKGAAVIRAFDHLNQFINIYENRTDYWMEVNFVSLNIRRWLTWRIQGMTAVLSLSAAVTMVAAVYLGWIGAGMVGVVMYNANRAGVMVQQIIGGWAELEVSGVALDRVLEYIDLKTEADEHIEDTKPVAEWPQEGRVHFKEFSTRYVDNGDDVLKKITFAINSNEKIGIVGRTGSGKSTITLSLFRLIEATNGNIDIDLINTSMLGLSDLRSELSIIPQDSQIFGGSLRENLDPFEKATDEKLWQVLSLCSLKEHFERLGTGLNTKLSDGGDNLSRGQTQLICLARALLRESKILVLDEATASVDVETDKIVQQTIRNEFKNCTIITIAHRLNTIMDSDRILVLNAGELVEFDTPANLIKSKSYFYELTEAQGSKESKGSSESKESEK